jgi:sialate O-acetylesterase
MLPVLSVFLAFLFLDTSVVHADVRLPSVLGDHMVLQQQTQVTLWGWAYEGEKVVVETSWGEKAETVADARGEWKVTIRTPKAVPLDRGLHPEWISFTVPDENSIQLKDILIGELWLASGQSNMCMMLGPDYPKGHNDWYGDKFWNEESRHTARPAIRVFNVEKTASPEPRDDCKGVLPDHITLPRDKAGLTPPLMSGWQVCSPKSAPYMSAVAYYFAVMLQKKLHVPVGIVTSAVGGSRIEAWISPEALRGVQGHESETTKVHRMGNSALYNGMIAPLLPMVFRGVIWYQGESNADSPPGDYARLLTTLIADWRSRFGNPALPFDIVQLANYGKPALGFEGSKVAVVREAQAQVAATVPGVGMAVAIDLGDLPIHTPDKRDVADRLARIALARTYGQAQACEGPVYQGMSIEGTSIRLRFKTGGESLIAKDGGGELHGFFIAGADGHFIPADARIEGETVVVSAPSVPTPVAVRYAWATNPEGCNLDNKAGLPASPFRTDTLPLPQK